VQFARGRVRGHISQQSIKHIIKEQKDFGHIGPSTEICKHLLSSLRAIFASDPGLSRENPQKKPSHLYQPDSYTR